MLHGVLHGVRHYEVRLRRSRRRPYVIARRLIVAAAVLLVIIAVFVLRS